MLNHAGAMQYSALVLPFAFVCAACSLDPAGSAGSGGVASHVASDDASTGSASTIDASAADAGTHAIDAGHGDIGAGTDEDSSVPACPGSGDGIALVAPMTSSPTYGTLGGQAFDDTCAADSVLVGIVVVPSQIASTSLSHVQALCAPIALTATCAIAMGAPVALVDHGTMTGVPQRLACPSDSVMVGVRVTTGLFIDSLAIDCAPILHDASGTVFQTGAVSTIGPVGGAGGIASPAFDCPAGSIANELAGATSSWISSLRIGCATPFIP